MKSTIKMMVLDAGGSDIGDGDMAKNLQMMLIIVHQM